ncbi:PKD domain-containing protein [Acanthopleuribacter pedis]|uniref:Calx-beta domain-containing protein n=1 Tax=Acanthopleuribacter pedis TaxID=442870 RepID=A0A8J7QDA8_9BACT|nr:Calx-beta domain-containing protein [Acanthopleuribacter pedis]MBO1321679.1 hypothetical protein [Acanthopleuribacter pedis]
MSLLLFGDAVLTNRSGNTPFHEHTTCQSARSGFKPTMQRLATVLVMTVLTVMPLTAQIYIQDSFDDTTLANWVSRGTAAAPNGSLNITLPGGSAVQQSMLPANETLTYSVDLRFNEAVSGGPDAVLLLSQTDTNEPFQGSNDAWFFRVGHEWGTWSYELSRRNAWDTTVLASGDLPQPLTVGTWYQLRVTRDGGNLSVSLMNQQTEIIAANAVDAANDPGGAYTALYAAGEGAVDFDQFQVLGPEGVLPPTVSFTTASATLAEDAGAVSVSLTLDAPAPAGASVTVQISGTATQGGDYQNSSARTLTFNEDDRAGTLSLTLIDDNLQESDETVILTLSNPVDLRLGTTTTHTLTIIDNDAPTPCTNPFTTMLPMWFTTAMPGRDSVVTVLDLVDAQNCTTCDSYTVTVQAGQGGTVTPTGSQTVACDQTLTITATPDTGFTFSGWSGDATGTTNPLTLDSSGGNQNLTANFQAVAAGPIANAGRDQAVTEGATVQLDGSASTGDTALTYAWQQTSGPTVALQNATTATPSWTAPSVTADTLFTFQLQVTDNTQATSTDTVAVTVRPQGGEQAPCAEAVIEPAPTAGTTLVSTLEIRNDRASPRTCEPAWSGIPIARSANLTDTTGLMLIDSNGNRVAAQFDIVSRWGGSVQDTSLPIRWLQISTITSIAAESIVAYEVRRAGTAQTDPNALTVTDNGTSVVVDTGTARFTLDPANPALFAQIALDSTGQGTFETIYTHGAGAGPRLSYRNGAAEISLSTAGTNEVRVEPDGFSIVETGPLKAVVLLRGRFSDPGGTSICAAGAGYERFAFTLAATFVRGSSDILMQYHLRNECSDANGGPWTDEFATVTDASWHFPFATFDTPVVHAGGDGDLMTSAAGFNGATTVTQFKGGGTPWRRRAEVQINGQTQENAEFFSNPMVALSDTNFIATGQMPWLRYREPQGLAVTNQTLSLHFVSESLTVGEGKGLWNFARVGLAATATAAAGQSVAAFLENERNRGRFMLERGLLPRATLDMINASGVYPSLGTHAPSAPKTAYLDTLNLMHNDHVLPGGQYDRGKIYGSQLWPEVSFDRWDVDNDTPADMNGTHAYWNPQGAEMLEFLRSGDPKWVWDFALPAAWLQMHTAYLNTGDQFHGNRNGFAVTSGGTGEGHWHRGAGGSDDYSYNDGMKLAYALRPNPIMRDRFRQAGRTIVDRYDIPRAQEAQRTQYVNRVEISRQVIQHFEMLANCAEYVPGEGGNACHDRLMELLSELTLDNLRAGIMCADDIPSTNCLNPQGFMMASMMYSFFMRSFRNYGDIEGILGDAMVDIGRNLFRYTMRGQEGQPININGDWAPMMDCTLNAEGTAVVNCTPFQVDDAWMYQQNRPHTAAMLLTAHELDPSISMCEAVRAIYDDPNFLPSFWDGYIGNDSGWWKGAAQMMQGMVFGIGVYDTCSDP